MKVKLPTAVAALLMAIAFVVGAEENSIARSPLDVPAQPSELAKNSRLIGIDQTDGGKIVAVGERGHIIISEDAGHTWRQAEVPVSSTLVSVHFVSEDKGWAVGHEGVVLSTEDGGNVWKMRLNGRDFDNVMEGFYSGMQASSDPAISRGIDEASRFVAEGADKPFLDVWFEDEKNGWVVGAFNLILRTEDGGITWEPWMHRVDNDLGYSLYSIGEVEGDIFIVGELGLLLRFDRHQNRFKRVEHPGAGTLFTISGSSKMILASGLEGSAIRSLDGGKSWKILNTGMSGGITDSAYLSDGRLALVTTSGNVALSDDDGSTVEVLEYSTSMPLSAVIQSQGEELLVLGSEGVQLIPLDLLALRNKGGQ